MDSLNYHHLLYFWVVAREGSIARATEKLRLTQPTISAQLRLLERSLGSKLFERRGRGLVLTDTGHAVYKYAEEIFPLGRELVNTLRGNGNGQPKRFAVGILDSMPKLTTYAILEPAISLAPAVKLVIRVGKIDQLLADLAVHTLDMVLTDHSLAPGQKDKAHSHLLGECPITVFAAPALASNFRKDFPNSLSGAPFLLPTTNTAMRRSLDQWFERCDLRPSVVAEIEDVAILQVFGGRGVGLFAAPAIVEGEICRQYRVQVVGRLDKHHERFYAITFERKIKHPAIVAVMQAAREKLAIQPAG